MTILQMVAIVAGVGVVGPQQHFAQRAQRLERHPGCGDHLVEDVSFHLVVALHPAIASLQPCTKP
jgi:hypothetical protein